MQDYNKVFNGFRAILQQKCQRAQLKKAEYLDRIVLIFKQFISKCEKEIDHIIKVKIDKLDANYEKLANYFQTNQSNNLQQQIEQRNLLIAQFLVKPFEKFPFAGNKNQKLFKEQYNLIQKASVLIEQTLIQSFAQDEVPTFQNSKFFQTIQSHGIGKQTLTKLRLNPQNFNISHIHDITPHQNRVSSLLKLNDDCLLCIGDANYVQLWDILDNFCLKKFNLDVPSTISTGNVSKYENCSILTLGFADQNPLIVEYRLDTWKSLASSRIHTQKITKVVHYSENYLISGSSSGLIVLHDFRTLKVLASCSHTSGIEDIFIKNTLVYILQKNSAVLEYNVNVNNLNNLTLNFRRTISAGYISIIRSPQLTTNFSGVGCHIYGLSQIEVTHKFKMQEINIINVPQMISDFIVLQSKQTSQFFAVCVFQNSSTIKIYSLTTQQQVYEYSQQYIGEVGASGYLPKLQISWINHRYILTVINQSQFQDCPNTVKCYELHL